MISFACGLLWIHSKAICFCGHFDFVSLLTTSYCLFPHAQHLGKIRGRKWNSNHCFALCWPLAERCGGWGGTYDERVVCRMCGYCLFIFVFSYYIHVTPISHMKFCLDRTEKDSINICWTFDTALLLLLSIPQWSLSNFQYKILKSD